MSAPPSSEFIEGLYYAICQKLPANAEVASIMAHAKSVKQAIAILSSLPSSAKFFNQFNGLSCNWIDHFLCVGAQPSPFQALGLVCAGITRFIDVSETCQEYVEALPENISYSQATIKNDQRNAPEDVEKAARLVLVGISDLQRVYLHCRSGMHRSAIVASVVMAVRNKTRYEEAVKFVKLRRPMANPLEELLPQQDAAIVAEKLSSEIPVQA